jgi:hypothetical protein
MARDILSEFGPDRPAHKESHGSSGLATGGGQPVKHDVHNYAMPQGPTNIHDAASPGLKGTNWGNSGTQGPPMPKEAEIGEAGISHEHHPHGSQR